MAVRQHHQDTRTLLALDPGTTTGVAIFRPSPWGRSHEAGWEHKEIQGHLELWKLLTSIDPSLVICERFQHRVGKPAEINTTNEMIGIVKLYCAATKKPLKLQTGSQAKGLWTDPKLRTVGVYKPGMKHAMDATRHMLYYLTVTERNMDFAQMLRTHG